MKALILMGSPRKEGNTASLTKPFVEMLETKGVEWAAFDLYDMVLASPIYSWYCTPPVKHVIDRLVYGMNKYYGEEMGPSIWKGKKMALISTCGYPVDKGADLWKEGMRRYCKHSKLEFLGMEAERQRNYGETFMDEEKEAKMRAFAEYCYQACVSENKK